MERQILTCRYCGSNGKMRVSAFGNQWYCPKCHDVYVGCHRDGDGTRPLGTMADKSLREWRMLAHKVFDPLWKEGITKKGRKKYSRVKRHEAYAILRKMTGTTQETAHIGMFDEDQCRMVVEFMTNMNQ